MLLIMKKFRTVVMTGSFILSACAEYVPVIVCQKKSVQMDQPKRFSGVPSQRLPGHMIVALYPAVIVLKIPFLDSRFSFRCITGVYQNYSGTLKCTLARNPASTLFMIQ